LARRIASHTLTFAWWWRTKVLTLFTNSLDRPGPPYHIQHWRNLRVKDLRHSPSARPIQCARLVYACRLERANPVLKVNGKMPRSWFSDGDRPPANIPAIADLSNGNDSEVWEPIR
jgi:hypothetical protein